MEQLQKCFDCNTLLVEYNPKKETKEKYLKCTNCNAVYAKVSIPNYKVTTNV
jgi:phage FluMu protein Com